MFDFNAPGQYTHTLNGHQIRDFAQYLRVRAKHELEDLWRDNRALERDAVVAVIELEASRRGIRLLTA